MFSDILQSAALSPLWRGRQQGRLDEWAIFLFSIVCTMLFCLWFGDPSHPSLTSSSFILFYHFPQSSPSQWCRWLGCQGWPFSLTCHTSPQTASTSARLSMPGKPLDKHLWISFLKTWVWARECLFPQLAQRCELLRRMSELAWREREPPASLTVKQASSSFGETSSEGRALEMDF